MVNRSMSTYLPDSDISKINREMTTKSMSILKRSLIRPIYCGIKHNYFDPTVGAWVNAYGFGPDKALKQITSTIRQPDGNYRVGGIQMTPDQRIVKDHPNIYLDFNAIAKGYTRPDWKILIEKEKTT